MPAMAISDLENLLGVTITGTTQQPQYEAQLTAAKNMAVEACNNPFTSNKQQTNPDGSLSYDSNGDPIYVQATKPNGTLIYDECNNPVYVQVEDIPTGAQMGIAWMVKAMRENPNVSSQTLGDMSKSFFQGATYKAALKMLRPYRKAKFIKSPPRRNDNIFLNPAGSGLFVNGYNDGVL